MRRSSYIAVIAILVALVSCGTTARKEVVKQSVAMRQEQKADSVALFSVKEFMKRADTAYRKEDLPLVYYIEGIKRLYIYGDASSARKLFGETIKLDSTYAPAYYDIATVSLDDSKKALEYSRKANELDTTEVRYKEQLGRLLVVNGLYDEAQLHYDKLIKLAPRSPENYSMLAALYEQDRQPFSAIGILERAEKVFGRVEELMEYKRELLINVKLFDKAIEEGKELLTANPYNYQNHLVLAQLYAETKKDSLAQVSYANALKLNPTGIDVLLSMKEYYRGTGKNTEYLETVKKLVQNDELTVEAKLALYKEAISSRTLYIDHRFQIRELVMLLFTQYPDNFEVLTEYAGNLLAFGELDEAAATYKRYIGTGVGGIDLFQEILYIEGYQQRTDSVNKYLAIALEHYPDSPDLYIRQAGAYQYMDKGKEAKKAYRNALKYADSDSLKSVIYGLAGDLYHMEDKHRKSYKYYELALKHWADNKTVLNNYAYYLSVNETELDKALEMSKKVVDELEPGNPTFIDTYGWVLFKLGRYEEARKALQQAVALDTHNSKELLVHYGDVLFKLGENYMASVYWNRALEAGYDADKIKERMDSIKSD